MGKALDPLPQLKTIFTHLHPLEIGEYAAVLGSVVGSVVAAMGQHLVWATAPLTIAIALNAANRQRLWQQHYMQNTNVSTQFDQRCDELTRQIASLPKPEEVNIKQIEEEISDLHKSISILENKSSFMANKVYQNISAEVETLRQKLLAISEPFDINRIEAKIAAIQAEIRALASKASFDPEDFQRLRQALGQIDRKQRELLEPTLTRLTENCQQLEQSNITLTGKLDIITQKFNARPEVIQLSRLKKAVEELRESVSQLQQTEVIAELLTETAKLRSEVTQLSFDFRERAEPQDIQQLQLLIKLLVKSMTQLKRFAPVEELTELVATASAEVAPPQSSKTNSTE